MVGTNRVWRLLPGMLAIAVVVSPIAAQPQKPLTLVGCVSRDESSPGQFTLSDEKGVAAAYRLNGKALQKYLGQRVQVTAVPDSGKLRIVGGLVPSANAAAQAGAVDPPPAAAGPGGPTRAENLPPIRVRTIKAVPGECRQ